MHSSTFDTTVGAYTGVSVSNLTVDGASDGAGYISDGWLVMNYHLSPAPVLQFTRSGQNIVISWNGDRKSVV